jgi:hypothetical protein
MKGICFVDYKADDGKWHKSWSTLLADVPVYCVGDFERVLTTIEGPNDLALAVIHDTVYGDDEWKRFRETILGQIAASPYVMLVSGDGLPVKTTTDGRIHASAVPFPNNTALSHLTKRLEGLLSVLQTIPRERSEENQDVIKRRHEAWRAWEAKEERLELVWALHLLCQAWFIKNRENAPYEKLSELKQILAIKDESPQLPPGIEVHAPGTRDEWLRPFKNGLDKGDDLLASTLNEMPTRQARTAVETFFMRVNERPAEFSDVADLFLELDAVIKTAL